MFAGLLRIFFFLLSNKQKISSKINEIKVIFFINIAVFLNNNLNIYMRRSSLFLVNFHLNLAKLKNQTAWFHQIIGVSLT